MENVHKLELDQHVFLFNIICSLYWKTALSKDYLRELNRICKNATYDDSDRNELNELADMYKSEIKIHPDAKVSNTHFVVQEHNVKIDKLSTGMEKMVAKRRGINH